MSPNRYDRREWAGALGDLGTLMPFVVAYVGLMKLDPFGILFAFGVSMVASGLVYRTPFPVQPMKAIGAIATTQAAQTAVVTSATVAGAGLITGAIWLLLGATGLTRHIGNWVGRPVARGISLGLGLAFMWQGVQAMATQWLLAAAGCSIVVLLHRRRLVPSIFVLLLLGVSWSLWREPALRQQLFEMRPQLNAPNFTWPHLGWHDLALAGVFLVLPQLPLTLGNAVIAVREENNRLFPDRPVTDKKIAISTGLMNVFGSAVGGIPMCHGAGGMAGHVAFGARTGGSLVILGSLLLILAVAFSASVLALFQLIPQPILGVVLLVTGAQLAGPQLANAWAGDRREAIATYLTAGLSIWNVGIGFVAGIVALRLLKSGPRP